MAFGDIVNTPATDTASSASTTAVTVTLESTATLNNLLVAIHFTGAADSVGVTDDDLNAFTEAVTATDASAADQGAIYYRVSDGTETSVIATDSNNTKEHVLSVYEIAGPINATPLDVVAKDEPYSGVDSGTTCPCGTTSTTTVASAIAIAVQLYSDNTPPTTTWSDSFSEDIDSVGQDYNNMATAHKVLSSTGAVTQTGTLSATSRYGHMGMIAVFSGEAAAGGRIMSSLVDKGGLAGIGGIAGIGGGLAG